MIPECADRIAPNGSINAILKDAGICRWNIYSSLSSNFSFLRNQFLCDLTDHEVWIDCAASFSIILFGTILITNPKSSFGNNKKTQQKRNDVPLH